MGGRPKSMGHDQEDGAANPGELLGALGVEDTAPHDRRQRLRAVRRLWRAEVLYLAALAAFAVLALLAHQNAYFGWDVKTSRAVQSLSSPWAAEALSAVSLLGSGLTPWALATVAFFAFFAFHRRSEAFGVALSAGGGQLSNRLIKMLVDRPRPAAPLVRVENLYGTESFPSGHVTFYVCFFGFLFFVAYALLPRRSFARRAALTLASLPVLLVGPSRVYLGAHWPSDTLGAYLFSALWLALSLHLYRRWKARATFHKPSAAVEE